MRFDGQDLVAASRRELRAFRRRTAMVFQDPYGSLDPRMTVRAWWPSRCAIHGRYHGRETGQVEQLLEQVHLDRASRDGHA